MFFAPAEAQTYRRRVVKLRFFSPCFEYQDLFVGNRIVYPSASYLSQKVMSEVSISRRRRSPSARSALPAYVYSYSSVGFCYRYSRDGTKDRFSRRSFRALRLVRTVESLIRVVSYLSQMVMSEVSVSRRCRSSSARSTLPAYVYSIVFRTPLSK
jgi:hypothetical protein